MKNRQWNLRDHSQHATNYGPSKVYQSWCLDKARSATFRNYWFNDVSTSMARTGSNSNIALVPTQYFFAKNYRITDVEQNLGVHWKGVKLRLDPPEQHSLIAQSWYAFGDQKTQFYPQLSCCASHCITLRRKLCGLNGYESHLRLLLH
jgi:hypothetical protein